MNKQYLARQVSDDEKLQLLPDTISIYPGYDEYQARTQRNIRVFYAHWLTELYSNPHLTSSSTQQPQTGYGSPICNFGAAGT